MFPSQKSEAISVFQVVHHSCLSPAKAFIHMYGRVYTVVAFDTILDIRGLYANGRDFHFLEPLSDYSIMCLVNDSANGCKNIMIYLEGSLRNAGMQVHNFEIDVIELFLNAHENVVSGSCIFKPSLAYHLLIYHQNTAVNTGYQAPFS